MRSLTAIILSLLALALPAQEGPADPAGTPVVQLDDVEAYREGRRALAANLPGIAVASFQDVLATARLTDEDDARLRLLLLEAAVRALDLDAMAPLKAEDLPATTAAAYWMAQGLALTGRLAEAEKRLGTIALEGEPAWRPYAAMARSALLVALKEPAAAIQALEPAAEDTTAFRAIARQSELLLLLGRVDEAGASLERLPEPTTPAETGIARYLAARLSLAQGDFETATRAFDQLADDPGGLSPNAVDACLLASVFTRLEAGRPDEAAARAVAVINNRPDERLVPLALDLFAQAGGFSLDAHRNDVESWLSADQAGLATATALQLARRRGEQEPARVAEQLGEVAARHPDAPQATMLTLTQASLLVRAKRPTEAEAALRELDRAGLTPEEKSAHTFLRAKLRGEGGEWEQAQRLFAEATTEATPETFAAALYNLGIVSFLLDETTGFEKAVATLGQAGGLGPTRAAELMLERGLFLTGRDPGLARLMLWRFLQAAPDHPRRDRAHLALAEVALLESPPAPSKARNQLSKITGEAPPDLRERRDYLLVWTADLGGDVDQVVEAAQVFLARWPDSGLADEVRFKVAETLAAAGRHAEARTHFAHLAANPSSPLREAALFHAARSAALSMTPSGLDEAIALFQQVVDLEGPLRYRARREQALALRRQGKLEAAASLLEATLEAEDTPEEDDARDLLSLRAELLLDQDDPDGAAAAEALRLFARLRDDPGASTAERHHAAWYLGRAAEEAGREDDALATWYAVVDDVFGTAGSSGDDWAFRCGISALELLRRRENWTASAALAERLGKSTHPRAEEARAMAERIRLRHFLFEEEVATPGDAPPSLLPAANHP